MFDCDFRQMFIAIALIGCVVGGIAVGGMLIVWPHLWEWLKPMIHAATA